MHSDRNMSISVVIDNSVLEKSLKSVIMDNGAPDKSDGAHNSSLDTNVYSATCQKSGDIEEGPQQPILKCYDPKKFCGESFSRDFNPAWYKRYPWLSYNYEKKNSVLLPMPEILKCPRFHV